MPLVSVVMPVYNCERFIDDAIRSILYQTFEDFEFIILNDGSTDKTWEIVDSFKDNRLVLINNHENKKIPERRNQGINIAIGKYIAIQDGDDISFVDRLQKQVEFLENNNDIFCVGGWAEKIDENGELCGQMYYPPAKHFNISKQFVSSPTNPIIDPTTMFRRQDFIDLGGYTTDKNFYTVPDFDLWGRALLDGKKFSNLTVPLIYYRINSQGMTLKHKNEMIRSHVMVLAKYYKRLKLKYLERREKNGYNKNK